MTIRSNSEADVVSGDQARQLVTHELLFHCGQSFIADTPDQVDGFWEVPVWVSHIRLGKIKQIGTVRVHTKSGEIQFSDSDKIILKSEARQVLSEFSSNQTFKKILFGSTTLFARQAQQKSPQPIFLNSGSKQDPLNLLSANPSENSVSPEV